MYVLLVNNVNLNNERMAHRFQSWIVSPQVGMALNNELIISLEKFPGVVHISTGSHQ